MEKEAGHKGGCMVLVPHMSGFIANEKLIHTAPIINHHLFMMYYAHASICLYHYNIVFDLRLADLLTNLWLSWLNYVYAPMC